MGKEKRKEVAQVAPTPSIIVNSGTGNPISYPATVHLNKTQKLK